MTITLLTAVPRTGKTSYAVWDIIKPAIEEGKTVYVCGIPKLQLPHIKVDHAWVRKWHERKYSESIEEDQLVQCLSNAHTFRLWPVTASWRYGHAEFFAKFLHLWHSKHNVLDFDCGQPNR